MQLYQFGPLANQESASPFCVKVHYAMRYKRLPFEVVNVASPLAVRRLSRRGKLPVMIYDGVTVTDSHGHHPPPRSTPSRAAALPERAAGPRAGPAFGRLGGRIALLARRLRALAGSRSVHHVAEVIPAPTPLKPIINLIAGRQVRGALRAQGLGRLQLAEQREKLGFALDWLDSMITGQFLGGGELSIADIAVAAQVAALDIPITPVISAEVRKHVHVRQWLDRTRAAVS
jgi:glutathione S-transferase